MADVQYNPPPGHGLHNMTPLCPTCNNPPDSQSRLDNLEHEVIVLTEQSIAAANKLASYEEEIATLRQQRSAAQAEAQHAKSASVELANGSGAALGTGPGPGTLTRFASFRYGVRKPSPSPGVVAPSSDVSDLQERLARETAKRQEAEKKTEEVHAELEDLSAQLFEQANEMVATERRARSKLEERVRILEERDKDKSRRLEMIEGAVQRLERVKRLLGT